MYQKRLGDANYSLFKLARTNNRGDGELSFLISACEDQRGGNTLLCFVALLLPPTLKLLFIMRSSPATGKAEHRP
jgi:hypothetical protein